MAIHTTLFFVEDFPKQVADFQVLDGCGADGATRRNKIKLHHELVSVVMRTSKYQKTTKQSHFERVTYRPSILYGHWRRKLHLAEWADLAVLKRPAATPQPAIEIEIKAATSRAKLLMLIHHRSSKTATKGIGTLPVDICKVINQFTNMLTTTL
jgi:hypothetical protein